MTDDSSHDDELELEPIDPAILEHERQRAERKTREADTAVDIDELYRNVERDDPLNLDDLKQFRFTTRHLLILTALLAVVMTLCELTSIITGLFISFIIALASGWFYTLRRERRQDAAVEKQRREMEARHAAQREDDAEGTPRLEQPVAVDINTAWQAAQHESQPEFRFSFSLKEMFVAFTIAAVLLGLISLFGRNSMAMILGLTALLGLVLHAMGFDPPPIFVFGWWMLLVLYLLVGLWVAVSPQVAVAKPQAATHLAACGLATTTIPSIG